VNKRLYIKMAQQFAVFPIVMGALLFLPAGTLDYWQAWVFVCVFLLCSLAISLWLAVADPKLLERRMKAGPAAETQRSQKIIVGLVFVAFMGLMLLPALDRRFGWSDVPAWLVILGDLLVTLSYVGFFLVFRENTYGAATIQVAEGQRVISTGPYALVRHPMYSAAVVLMLGVPLALGSWWGLVLVVSGVAVLVWRILDEERFLSDNLAGYTDYKNRVRFRLVPLVW
jgi:protein-S-isoprenylcysteine O-methyltransferase Ste14